MNDVVTDSFFIKGSTHKICEDYAAHNEHMAVLSDGCSTAEDTHIGAMLLCEHRLLSQSDIAALN